MKLVAVCIWLGLALAPASGADDLALWYRQPAKSPMNEALPIGNGRLGALVFGAPDRERLSVTEDSLWTGDENPSGNYDSMGAYQVLGNVYIVLPGHTNTSAYRRDLDGQNLLPRRHAVARAQRRQRGPRAR